MHCALCISLCRGVRRRSLLPTKSLNATLLLAKRNTLEKYNDQVQFAKRDKVTHVIQHVKVNSIQ
jgi:hypothetical protein